MRTVLGILSGAFTVLIATFVAAVTLCGTTNPSIHTNAPSLAQAASVQITPSEFQFSTKRSITR